MMVAIQEEQVQENKAKWSYKYEPYLLQVLEKGDGFWGVITRGGDLEWSGATRQNFEDARGELVCQLHVMRPDILQPGSMIIEPELLAFHPRNKEIYSDSEESNQELINQIRKSGKIYRLTVTATTDAVQGGLTVSGNRRLSSAIALNQEALENGEPKPFPFVDVEVKEYHDELEILDDLVRENLYRNKKTQVELFREYSVILEVEKKKAEQRMKSGTRQKGEKGTAKQRAATQMGKLTGISKEERTWSSGATHTHWMDGLKESGEKKLASDVESLINKGMVSAVKQIRDLYSENPELAKEVAEIKNKPENKGKANSVGSIVKQIKAEQAKEESKQVETKEELIKQAIKALEATGAKTSDDYLTPLDIKMTLIEFLGTRDDDGIKRVDLDPFANLEKDSIPARTAYNVFDNGLKQELHGTMATNIPFSIAGDCVKAFDKAIREGTTKEGAFVAQSGILHNKATQEILTFHKMSVCLCRGRVAFGHGSILSFAKPDKKADNTTTFNTDTAIFYYGDRHEEFYEDFKHKGTVTRLGLQPSDTSTFFLPKWVDNEERKSVETNWMGKHIEIMEDDEGLFVPWISNNNTGEQFEELKQAQSYAIGYILMNQASSTNFDSSVFS